MSRGFASFGGRRRVLNRFGDRGRGPWYTLRPAAVSYGCWLPVEPSWNGRGVGDSFGSGPEHGATVRGQPACLATWRGDQGFRLADLVPKELPHNPHRVQKAVE